MNVSDFASLCYELEKTPSRLAKIAAAAEYLKRLAARRDSARRCVFVRPARFLFPILEHSTSGPARFLEAAKIPEAGNSSSTPLTLKDIADSFGRIAEASGKGSRLEKYGLLKELIERADSRERPILLRLLHNELRIGLHDGLFRKPSPAPPAPI